MPREFDSAADSADDIRRDQGAAMKNNLPYFSHDNSARNNPKMLALRARFGWTGYGQLWALVEMIAAADEARLDLGRKVVRSATACELGMTTDALESFLEFLSDEDECGLILYQDGVVTTKRTSEGYARVESERLRKRGEGKNGAEARWNSAENSQNSAENLDNSAEENGKAKQSKANNIKAEQSRADAPAAAAVYTVQEIESQLRLCRFAERISTGDKLIAAQRMSERGLDLGFVGYCIERTNATNPRNPGGFLRSALLGAVGFEDYPEQYREARPPPEPARAPHPTTCESCGKPLRAIDGEWVCKACGSAWAYDQDFDVWEAVESYVPIKEAQG